MGKRAKDKTIKTVRREYAQGYSLQRISESRGISVEDLINMLQADGVEIRKSRVGFCQRCGCEVPDNTKWCQACAKAVQREQDIRYKQNRREKRVERSERSVNSGLVAIAQRAREAGMSYGRYVGTIEGR